VLRGGGWGNSTFDLRSSCRLNMTAFLTGSIVGFRVARAP
jgi:formylglycine-generating enzyme required for sulfatase activity